MVDLGPFEREEARSPAPSTKEDAVLLRVEVSPEVRLELEGSDVVGFERSAMLAERDLRPAMWAELLEAYQEAVLDHVCGARRAPPERGRRAPFRCPAHGAEPLAGGLPMRSTVRATAAAPGRRRGEPRVARSGSSGGGARDGDPVRNAAGAAPDRDRPRGVHDHGAEDRGSGPPDPRPPCRSRC